MSDKDYTGESGATGVKGTDNYKPLRFYTERVKGGEKNGFNTFEEGGDYFFCYCVDGDVVLISESYSSEKGRDNGVNSVEKNMVIRKRYKPAARDNGQHYFGIVAGNHQEVATSTWFDSEAAMLAMTDRLISGEWTVPRAAAGALAAASLGGSEEVAAPTKATIETPITPPLAAASTASASVANSTPPTSTPSYDVVEDDKGGSVWWWLLLPLLLLLLWWMFAFCSDNKCGDKSLTTPEMPKIEVPKIEVPKVTVPKVDLPDAPKLEVPEVPKLSLTGLGKFFGTTLPNGIALDIPEFGVENKLIGFIKDDGRPVDKTTWFNFDRINFETGSSILSAESQEQIENIVNILAAYPDVNIKLGGYTDNRGSLALNQKLSQDRADAVKAAIIVGGIESERIATEGYGPQFPVASNDTAEGQAKNRRIAIRVTQK